MNATQELLCEILEETTDRQDHLPWWEREWDIKDLRSWLVCCIALPFYIKGERDVLARALKCYCDAESRGSQHQLTSACEAFCERPYGNETYIQEIVKAAPVMLRTSPINYGEIFQTFITHEQALRQTDTYFLTALQNLETQEEKQTIIDFIVYQIEKYPDDETFQITLDNCLKVTGLTGGSSQYFNEYM